jgi:hypothetical protein
MLEQEVLPEHELGPIRYGEETSVVEGVQALLDGIPFLPAYGLPEAPPTLQRRFWLARDDTGVITPAWRDLPDDLCGRAHYGDLCARQTVASTAAAFDDETFVTTRTPADVWEIYCRTLWELAPANPEFDLHDVYVCTEALYVREYERLQKSGGRTEYSALPAIRATLELLIETIGCNG